MIFSVIMKNLITSIALALYVIYKITSLGDANDFSSHSH